MFKAKERLIDSFFEDFKEACNDYLGDSSKKILEKCKISNDLALNKVEKAPVDQVQLTIDNQNLLGKREAPGTDDKPAETFK